MLNAELRRLLIAQIGNEEESKLPAIVNLIESGINLFQAEALLERFE
jgi:hypothetical protein